MGSGSSRGISRGLFFSGRLENADAHCARGARKVLLIHSGNASNFFDKCGRGLGEDSLAVEVRRGCQLFRLCTGCSAGVVEMLKDMRLIKEPMVIR